MNNAALPEDPSADWPMRSWGLAVLGGLCGLLIFWIGHPDRPLAQSTHADLRVAAASFIGTGALLFAFLVERTRLSWSVAFAIAGGLLLAFTIYWNGPFGSARADEPWRIACALVTVAIAAPLFQTWRGEQVEGRPWNWSLPYHEAYRHVWTNVVLWLAAWAFTGVVWAMAFLLGQLFRLIGIHFLSDLLGKEWMALTLTGAALGAGIGLLRDRDRILDVIQRVVTTVLAVLAPLLAIGLLLFLIAIPFTGLTPLWDATRSTSPILLTCVAGALCLATVVIGDHAGHETRNPLMRASVAVLGMAALPLGIIAAVSTGLRIQQYGLTPDRLWATIFAAIACAYGLAYLVTILRWRLLAAPHLRIANMRLAIGLCGLALLLATPIINFGALSAADQVARLNSGRVAPEKFDWVALRFDFGRAGEARTRDLAQGGKSPQIRRLAAKALSAKDRWTLLPTFPQRSSPAIDRSRLVVQPSGASIPAALLDRLTEYDACFTQGLCLVRLDPGREEALIVTSSQARVWRGKDGAWAAVNNTPIVRDKPMVERIKRGLKAGRVEVRPVTRQQVFIDGVPVGDEFD